MFRIIYNICSPLLFKGDKHLGYHRLVKKKEEKNIKERPLLSNIRIALRSEKKGTGQNLMER